MIMAYIILLLSTALFIFYVQTVCENVLRREFARDYSLDILGALNLEFPYLQEAVKAGAPMSQSKMRLALQCDYFMLRYLVKNKEAGSRRFSWRERLVTGYFRLLLLLLPLRCAFHIREKQAVMKLTVILRYFANLVGERLVLENAPGAALR